MIWGIVFSYLEGRKFTEILAIGLSISLIVSSGILKTLYFDVENGSLVSEFWMPFTMGLLFSRYFLFVWMLSVIPAPSQEDILARAPRLPMNNEDKRTVFRNVLGVLCYIILYTFLATLRDFHDFAVEIWNRLILHLIRMYLHKQKLLPALQLAAIGSLQR